MNLNVLRSAVLQQEIRYYTVVNLEYESPRRYGIGLGTLAPPNWYVTLRDDRGYMYRMPSCGLPLRNSDTNQLTEGDSLKLEAMRIFGIPVYWKEVE